MQWTDVFTIGFTLNDGQNCKAVNDNFKSFHTFDPNKKITRIETIISSDEYVIAQINFYHNEERLVATGKSDSVMSERGGVRVIFDIAANEQLIGCEIHKCEKFFRGVTWLKLKISW